MNRLFFLLGLAGLLLAAGGRKDDVIDCAPTPTPTSNSSLEDFTRRNGVPVQSFGVVLGPGAVPQVITTSGGARLTLPPTSFLLPNGSVASGVARCASAKYTRCPTWC